MRSNQQEPLFHVSKRGAIPWWQAWCIRGGALLLALLVSSAVTVLVT